MRRALTRCAAGSQPNAVRQRALKGYRDSKRALKKGIVKSKKAQFGKLLEEINNDLWGYGYRIVMKNLNLLAPQKHGLERMRELARPLFPVHDRIVWDED